MGTLFRTAGSLGLTFRCWFLGQNPNADLRAQAPDTSCGERAKLTAPSMLRRKLTKLSEKVLREEETVGS